MYNFPLLVKPISDLCNLNCTYCFYKDRPTLPKILQKKMKQETLERMISVYQPYVEEPCYIWQGGEPTLLGLDFFKEASRLQTKAGTLNVLQTNGLMIDDEWAIFFKENNWFIGVSLDSKENKARGMDTKRVEETISTLKKFEVPYNILCTVSKDNVYSPKETIEYLSNWATNIQFIPAQPLTPGCFSEAPTGDEYRDFLKGVLGAYRDLQSYPVIENFEQAALAWKNVHVNCESTQRCGTYLTIEADGGIYPCDFFVEDKWKIGNIFDIGNITYMFGKDSKMESFRDLKELPNDTCDSCHIKKICNSGCPRHRYLNKGNHEDLSIYCEAHKYLYQVGYLTNEQRANKI